jgi:acetoin utilization deacetylase AcuC-like enzyme
MMKIVYNTTLEAPNDPRISFHKAAHVMKRVCPDFDYIPGPIATRRQLARAHDLDYVGGIINCSLPNGFGETGNVAKQHLDFILAANGVMIKAVEVALQNPSDAIFAPVSGFHHAHFAHAEGYCTFNGLVAAIANARLWRRVERVLIIDGDVHWGNGTDDILEKLALRGIYNLTHEASHSAVLRPQTWEEDINDALHGSAWDRVIYQAGADAHVDDSMMGGYLNDDEWEARDRLVFQYCQKKTVPLVFNLAGGYNGEKTVDLHVETVRMARTVYRSSAIPA